MHSSISRFKHCSFLVLLICIGAFTSAGWLQPDEHARVIEIAGYLLRGFGSLAWEFNAEAPIVSMFLGALHVPALWLAEQLHLDPLAQAGAMRLFSGLVCLTRVWAFDLILRHFKVRHHLCYTILFALSPYCAPFLARTSQENWGTTAFLWAFLAFLRVAKERARGLSFLFGALLALSVCFRLQMGPTVLAFAIAFAVVNPWSNVVWAFIGGISGLVPMAVVDYAITGVPFKPAYNYLQYALSDEEGGMLWGTSPWYFYLKAYLSSWFPPFGLFLLPILIWGLFRCWPLAVALVPFFLVHSALGHKELRYFSPMLPIMALAMIVGWEDRRTLWRPLARWKPGKGARRFVQVYVGLLLFVGIGLTLAVQNPSPFLYNELREMKESGKLSEPFVYAANSRSNVSQFYFPFPDALPEKIDFDSFWQRFDGMGAEKNNLTTHYAIYRMNIDKFLRLEEKCRIEFVSSGPLFRAMLHKLAPLLRARDVDGIVLCPGGSFPPSGPPPL